VAGLPGDATGYRLTATEVKETAFRLDGVLLPPEDAPGQRPVLFLENQFQSLASFYPRWLAAIFLSLYRQEVERPWVAVAVFPTRTLDPSLGPAFTALEPAGLLRRVYLEDLLERGAPSEASLGLRLLRLVVLDTDALPEAAGELADAARTEPDPLPLLDLIETILVYKLPNLSRDEIKAMLNLPDTDLKQTRFYKEVFAEGRVEGRVEGREDAQRRTALNLLRQTELDDAAIAAATGLGADEVAALRQGPGAG
jgi:predicted transposase/invertase (TIGR01784 family)